jgi:Domain of unknown function (DUF4190)
MTQQPPTPPPPGPGQDPRYPFAYDAAPAPNHPRAVPALVLGILSIVLCGLFTGIPAMIMGRSALRDIRASQGKVGGEGLAQGGFWTGLIGTVWTGLVTVFVLGVFAFGSVVHQQFQENCEQVLRSGHHHHQVQQNCP